MNKKNREKNNIGEGKRRVIKNRKRGSGRKGEINEE